jgi:hypothetical protein
MAFLPSAEEMAGKAHSDRDRRNGSGCFFQLRSRMKCAMALCEVDFAGEPYMECEAIVAAGRSGRGPTYAGIVIAAGKSLRLQRHARLSRNGQE